MGLEITPMETVLLHAIIKMIHKILFNQDMVPLVFKMRYLLILQKAVQSDAKMDGDGVRKSELNSLQQLVTKISNLIKKHLQQHPKHIIDFYCTKTKTDVQRIKGYKAQQGQDAHDIYVLQEDAEQDEMEAEVELLKLRIIESTILFKVNMKSPSIPVQMEE